MKNPKKNKNIKVRFFENPIIRGEPPRNSERFDVWYASLGRFSTKWILLITVEMAYHLRLTSIDFFLFCAGLMVQWWILSSSIRSSNVQSAPEWILLENVPCGHELPTYIPTIIIIITYHTVKLTITMARIVVYYYVLLVDFFKDTEKNEFYIPFTYVAFILRFCIHTKVRSL